MQNLERLPHPEKEPKFVLKEQDKRTQVPPAVTVWEINTSVTAECSGGIDEIWHCSFAVHFHDV